MLTPRDSRTAPGVETGLTGLPPSILTNTWKSKAKASFEGTTDTKYRSAALQCEVKLAEALSKAPEQEIRPNEDHVRPQQFRTAVCIELMGELCEMAGPFGSVLQSIREELALAIYSDYYQAGNDALAFDQLPYYTVVDELEAEKAKMMEEQARWKADLLDRERDVLSIDERMRQLEKQVREAETLNADLAAKLEDANDRAARSKSEVRSSREELKQLRKELLHSKEDMQRMRTAGHMQQVEAEELEKLRLTSAETQKELVNALVNLEKEREFSATSVPGDQYTTALKHIDELKRKLNAANAPTRALTPRPDWRKLNPFDRVTTEGKTVDLVNELCGELKVLKKKTEELKEMDAKLAEAKSLLEPEPEAGDPYAGNFLAAVDQQATVAEGEDGESTGKEILMPSLGSGPELPRFLRFSKDIRVQPMNKRTTELFMEEVWECKQKSDAARKIPYSLHEFLYQHLRIKHKSQHAQVAEFGYNFYAALQQYNYDADVEMFLKVLTGAITEYVRADREVLTKALTEIMESADASSEPGGGGAGTAPGLIKRERLTQALKELFPSKTPAAMSAITRALEEDQPGEMVDYVKLFENDEDMNQGEFIETVYDQHLAEIQEYVDGVSDAIRTAGEKIARKKAGVVLSGGGGGDDGASPPIIVAPLSVIREAILSYEPGKPEGDLDAYIARGARLGTVSEVRLQCELGLEVPVEEFISRMNTALVKRSDNYSLEAVHRWKTAAAAKKPGGGSTSSSHPQGAVSQPGKPSIA